MTWKQSCVGAFAFVTLASAAQAADLRPVGKAPPPEPLQQASGYVEIYTGWANTEAFNSLEGDGWVLGGAGRANYWLGSGLSVQVDAQAEGTSYKFDGENGRFSSQSYLVGGHLSWRNPQQYLFGVFAAAGDSGGLFTEGSRHGLIGGEAQWYLNQFTLYGQVGYDNTINNPDFFEADAVFVRGTGRYFFTPNFLIEGTFLYASGDLTSFGDSVGFDTWVWQAKAEWRFPTAPFSVFAKYQGSETKYDVPGDFDVTDHRVLFGLKLNMGDRNLQATDRAGATLDIISPLSDPSGPLRFLPN